MTVAEAQHRVSSREFSEWIAFYRLEPWGSEMDDLRTGIVAATIANAHRGKGKSYKPADFMPSAHTRRTEEQMQAQILKAMGGKRSG